MSDHFKLSEKFRANACVNAMILVKFKITNNGKIDSLDVSANGPFEIREALKRAIMSTDGRWRVTEDDKKHTQEITFLLPVNCYYQGGCALGLVENLSPAKSIDLKSGIKQDSVRKIMPQLVKPLDPNDTLRITLDNMLKFEKSSFTKLNCVLLTPVILYTIN